jgi:hypothetical protein
MVAKEIEEFLQRKIKVMMLFGRENEKFIHSLI